MKTVAQWRVRVSGLERQVQEFLARHPVEVQHVLKMDEAVRFDLTVDEETLQSFRQFGLVVEQMIDLGDAAALRADVAPSAAFTTGYLPKPIGRLLR